eukprot:3384974-Lingulodinium_polyedra.AAC.1
MGSPDHKSLHPSAEWPTGPANLKSSTYRSRGRGNTSDERSKRPFKSQRNKTHRLYIIIALAFP